MAKFTIFAALLAASSAVTASPVKWDFPAGSDRMWEKWINKPEGGNGQHPGPPQCTYENQRVRKDFNKATPQERKAYTDGIQCIANLPSQLDKNKYPGAINRYFDYATIHVNLTQVVHVSGYFLSWHRTFIHLFEEDMRQHCGFNGPMLYWNFPDTVTADELHNAPIFDGSEYSMGSDGYLNDTGPYVLSPSFSLPHGLGGGCIKSGPFSDWHYTMKPIASQLLLNGSALPDDAFGPLPSNPCLTRDLNPAVATQYLNQTAYEAALQTPDQAAFSTAINGVFGGGSLGLHSGAHFVVGPPASNIFVSVQDPIWWPLHTMLDKVYSEWQTLHPERADEQYGTMTANNAPPSANVTVDSNTPDFGYFGPSRRVGDLLNITAGPFCYRYE